MKATAFLPFLPTFSFFLFPFSLSSQSNLQQSLSINAAGTAADASALLDVSANNKGILIPRMTTIERVAIASPATGLLVYDSSSNGFFFYNGVAWVDLSAPRLLVDTDGDTRIEVEQSPDEDIVRMSVAGSERLLLRQNASGSTLVEFPNNGDDVYLGTSAGMSTTTGDNNTAVGKIAMSSNTTGGDNSALGAFTLSDNSTGAQNTALGAFALGANTTASENTAAGYLSLATNTAGAQNTAVGALTLRTNSTGNENTAIGYRAMFSNTTGPQNTAVGNMALEANTTGDDNSALGHNAMAANTTGHDNAAVGNAALFSNTSGSENVAVGRSALGGNTTGTLNTALGRFALQSNTNASFNTAAGALALRQNTSGANTAIGYAALSNNTTGSTNVAAGINALLMNSDGFDNTAVGGSAMAANTTGDHNTAIGASAMDGNTTGVNNTAVGDNALANNTTGSSNTALGYLTRMSAANQINSTAIGARAEVVGNNNLVLGSVIGVNGATATVNVGIGTTLPTQRLEVVGNVYASGGDLYTDDIGGVINAGCGIANADVNIIADDGTPTLLNANGDEDLYIEDVLELGNQGFKPGGGTWAAASDRRLKKDIRPYQDGLAQVLQVNPVRYRYNDVFPVPDGGREYVGIIAQEIAVVAPYTVELTPFGKKVKEDGQGNEIIVDPGQQFYTYDGTALTYMLVNAVKEQQAIIETQAMEIQRQKEQLGKITAALAGGGIAVEK